MSVSDGGSYTNVKRFILERYGLNALAYSEKFRHSKQDKTETFKEYAIIVEEYLKHWADTEEISDDHYRLYVLFMWEQLMFTASSDLQVWLREKIPYLQPTG